MELVIGFSLPGLGALGKNLNQLFWGNLTERKEGSLVEIFWELLVGPFLG